MADWHGVEKVAVFRALVLGDLLCATPALRVLRAGLPEARITLVGLPWARELAERLESVDGFIEFPGWPGLPERPVVDPQAPSRFVERMRAERFDLAVQLHGSGGIVNPLVASFGARRNAGFVPGHRPDHGPAVDELSSPKDAWPSAADAANFVRWPESGTEVERLLRLTDHLGLPRQGTRLDFPLRADDFRAAQGLLADLSLHHGSSTAHFAIVHPGSQLPSRRWPPERFAAVADALADAGMPVLLTGSAAETGLTAAVAAAMRAPALDLSGRTDLWTLGALIDRAALLLSNDTGLSHVAAARGTTSVVVSSGGDARRWAPADASRHTVLWHDLPCRPCAHAVCPIAGHPCATAVPEAHVREAALNAVRASQALPA